MKKSALTLFFGLLGLSSPLMAVEYGSFTDPRDGQVYKTVQINGATWLAENMRYAGEDVACHANNKSDPDFVKNYGCLYVWSDAQKACPAGWHLPNKADFAALLVLIGGENYVGDKDIDITDARDNSWLNSKNNSGFGAVPAGEYFSGAYGSFGRYAHFWSSEKATATNAYYLFLGNSRLIIRNIIKSYGYSVRCIKDSTAPSSITYQDADNSAAMANPPAASGSGQIANGKPRKIIASYNMSLGYVSNEYRFLNKNGTSWFAILDDCTYRAFSRYNGKQKDPAAAIIGGKLAPNECKRFSKPLPLKQKCTEIRWRPAPTDQDTHFFSARGKTLSCYITCCQGKGAKNSPECKIEQTAMDTLDYLLQHGEPMETIWRGYLIPQFDDDEAEEDKNKNSPQRPLKHEQELPAGFEKLYTPKEEVAGIYEENVFRREFQPALTAIMHKVKNSKLITNHFGGIPVKGSSGKRYFLYMRPIADIEDLQTGDISFPNSCKR